MVARVSFVRRYNIKETMLLLPKNCAALESYAAIGRVFCIIIPVWQENFFATERSSRTAGVYADCAVQRRLVCSLAIPGIEGVSSLPGPDRADLGLVGDRGGFGVKEVLELRARTLHVRFVSPPHTHITSSVGVSRLSAIADIEKGMGRPSGIARRMIVKRMRPAARPMLVILRPCAVRYYRYELQSDRIIEATATSQRLRIAG